MNVKKSKTEPYSLFTNNRFWLLCASGLTAVVTVLLVLILLPPGELRLIRIQQTYGLLGFLFIYIALLAAPLTKIFPNITGKSQYLHLRRAIGVSAFFFALLHSLVAFFGQLGGFNGLGFLAPRYGVALALGLFTLIILTAMAVTSFDSVIHRMGFPRWKKLHRLIYLASLALLIHVVMLGTHFAYESSEIARLTMVAVLFLLMLEAVRIDRWLKQRFAFLDNFGVATMVVLHMLFLGTGYAIGKNSTLPTSNIRAHGGHGGSQQEGDRYISFESSVNIDGRYIQPNRQTIAFNDLVGGGQTVDFVANPIFTDIKKAECFLVNQQTYTYYNGLTKIEGDTIRCLPIGDIDPPPAGEYTLYLRLERADTINTTPFNLEITQ